MAPYFRVGWSVAAVLLFVSLPITVTPFEARWTGGLGLGLILLALGLAQYGKLRPGGRAPPVNSVMDALIPLDDEMAIRRNVTLYGYGPAAMTVDFLRAIPEALVRAATGTGVVLFVAAFSLLYLLTWGVDPGVCHAATTACSGAYSGLGRRASVGGLVNLAVQGAFFNLSGTVAPASRFAQGLMDTEFLLSALLLVSYARLFGLPETMRGRLG